MLQKCIEDLKQKHPCKNCLVKAICKPKSRCELKENWEKHFRSYYVPLFVMFVIIFIFAIAAHMGIGYVLWFFRIIDDKEIEKFYLFDDLFNEEELYDFY